MNLSSINEKGVDPSFMQNLSLGENDSSKQLEKQHS
jgi:hypothetical protein